MTLQGVECTKRVFSGRQLRRSGRVQFTMFGPRQWVIRFGEDPTLEYPSEVIELDEEIPPDEGPRPWESTDPEPDVQGRLFYTGGVQMRYSDWQAAYLRNIRALGVSMKEVWGRASKIARSFTGKARAMENCGTWVEATDCGGCGAELHRLIATCGSRFCPRCARVTAVGKRRALQQTIEKLSTMGPHWFSDGTCESYKLFLVTLTARFDPTDPDAHQLHRYQRRHKALKKALRRIHREILTVDRNHDRTVTGAGTHFETEVSYGGLLHIHAAHWGLYLCPTDLKRCHEIVTEELQAVGEGDGGFDYKAIDRDKRGTYSEVCKYITKSSGPRRTLYHGTSTWMDPALAAVVTWAMARQHCTGGWGTLRRLEKDALDHEDHVGRHKDQVCRSCGTIGEWVNRRTVRACFVRYDQIQGVCRAPPLMKWREKKKAPD